MSDIVYQMPENLNTYTYQVQVGYSIPDPREPKYIYQVQVGYSIPDPREPKYIYIR